MIETKEFLDLQNFLVNLKDNDDFKPAQFSLARQYNLTKTIKDSQNQPYSFFSHAQLFRHNGPALYLYFVFLKKLCILFAIFTLMSFPSLLINYFGNGLEYRKNSKDQNVEFKLTEFLTKFSLANHNRTEGTHWVGYFSWNIVVLNDLLISLMFLGFLVYWAVELEDRTEIALTERGLPSYYTIIVQNLPDTYTQPSIKQFFGEFGDVIQVSTVKELSNVHKNINKIESLLDKLLKQKNNNNMYRIYIQLIDQYKDLRALRKKSEESKPLSAFITFDQVRNRDYVLGLADTQNFVFEGEELKVEKCNIQPANIVWENYHIDQKKHYLRSVLIWILVVLILLSGITMLFFVRASAKVGEGLSIEKIQVDMSLQDISLLDDEKIINSYCYNQGFKGYFKPEIRKLCKPFYSKMTRHITLIFEGSGIIIILNIILNIIYSYLAKIRRHATVTDRNVFLIICKAFSVFITSALLMLLLQCEIGGVAPRQFFEWVFRIDRKHDLYKEFSRKWYLDMGAQIIMTYILAVLILPLFHLLVGAIKKGFRYAIAKCKKRQGAMNQAYLDPEFGFNLRYSDIINATFTCLTFSPALPILYPLCCITLTLIYWTSKLNLLKLSREPHPSDHTLNEIIGRIMPIGLFVHAFMSRHFFSSKSLFPRSSKLPIVCMVIIMLLTAMFYRWRKEVIALLRSYINRNKESFIFEENKSLRKLLETQKKFLYSYRMEDNPEYQNVFYTIMLIDMFEKNKRAEMDGKAKSERVIPASLEELEVEDVINYQETNRKITKSKESTI